MKSHWLFVSRTVITLQSVLWIWDVVFRFCLPIRVRATPPTDEPQGALHTGYAVAWSKQTVKTNSIKILGNSLRCDILGATLFLLEVSALAQAQSSATYRGTKSSTFKDQPPVGRFMRLLSAVYQLERSNPSRLILVHGCWWLTRGSFTIQ